MAHRSLAIFRRRLFTILSVMSVVFCIATIALWVRGYTTLDYLRRDDDFDVVSEMSSYAGRLRLYFRDDAADSANAKWFFDSFRADNSFRADDDRYLGSAWYNRLGFLVDFPDSGQRYGKGTRVAVPNWFLVLLFAILPALWLRSFTRSRRRLRVGLCPVCGYDLRATPERCPECGSAASQIPITKPE